MGVVLAVIWLPGFQNDSLQSVSWLLSGIVLLVWGLIARRSWCLVVMIIAGVFIGGWRGATVQSEMEPYDFLNGKEVIITGTVSEDVDIGRGGDLVLRLKGITLQDQQLPGRVWVVAPDNSDVRRSDRVTVSGQFSEGFGGFSGAIYRSDIVKIERPQPGDVALEVRDAFAIKVREVVPDPEASLGIGYLVGQRRALPPELDEALKVAGLTHIVVASGYNLTILVRIARRLFVGLSKYLAALSAGGMILAFIAVTGVSPSMSRAGLVAGLSLLAWYYGRKFHPLVLLSLVAAATLLVNPSYGWNDLGWQLSFAAFAGVMILAPLLQAYFFGDKKPGTIRQIFGETLSAQIFTLPIIVGAFGVMSNVALIANVLVLPLVPLAMLLTFVAGVGSFVLPTDVANFVALPASWLLGYMTGVASWLADLPWAQTEINISGWIAAGFYGLIIIGCVYMWRRTGLSLRNHNIVE